MSNTNETLEVATTDAVQAALEAVDSAAVAAVTRKTGLDLFDFDDLSDVPEELSRTLVKETSDNALKYANLVKSAFEYGYTGTLNITKIMIAANRAGFPKKTQASVRIYLNDAVNAKLIKKPTRQTYAHNDWVGEVEEEEDEKKVEAVVTDVTEVKNGHGDGETVGAVVEVTTEDDPLAGF